MTALLRDYHDKSKYSTPKPIRPVKAVIYALIGLAGVIEVVLLITTSR